MEHTSHRVQKTWHADVSRFSVNQGCGMYIGPASSAASWRAQLSSTHFSLDYFARANGSKVDLHSVQPKPSLCSYSFEDLSSIHTVSNNHRNIHQTRESPRGLRYQIRRPRVTPNGDATAPRERSSGRSPTVKIGMPRWI